MYNLKVKKLNNFPEDKSITMPRSGDVGIDIFAAEDVFICNNTTARIRTGLSMQAPDGFWLMVKDRSSKALYYEVNAGVIDTSYTGEILVSVRVTVGKTLNTHDILKGVRRIGTGFSGHLFQKGDKIAQIVIMRSWNNSFSVEEVTTLEATERGESGFGSTGS